jgi:DNA/RNA endonuclease YhcR with UshA esterase domain
VLTIRDRTGRIDVTFTSDLVLVSGAPPQVEPGDFVEVRGAVTQYDQSPQIALEAADALQLLPEGVALATQVAIGEIRPGDVGDRVHIRGVVTEAREISGGRICLLDDGTGTISLLLWQDILRDLESPDALREGAWVSALGIVAEYRGDLELVPELALDVRLSRAGDTAMAGLSGDVVSSAATPEPTVTLSPTPEALRVALATPTAIPSPSATSTPLPSPSATVTAVPSPTATPEPTATPTAAPTATTPPTDTPLPGTPTLATGQVTAALLGQEVRVVGLIAEARALSAGAQFLVDDGSGPVVAYVPPEVYAQLPNPGDWIVGSRVGIEGRVQEYNEQIEIVPPAADSLEVLAAAVVCADVVPIGGLSASQVDQRVTVRGQIVEARAFSKGMQYVLDDGSGRITLLLWQNVYDVVPCAEELTQGVVVCTAGVVGEYRGTLEIVPAVGGDVAIE